jgi:hypothetical protein
LLLVAEYGTELLGSIVADLWEWCRERCRRKYAG